MGHKTHPIGLRLGIVRQPSSRWFASHDPVLHAEHLDRAEAPEAAGAYLLAAQAQLGVYRFERARALLGAGRCLLTLGRPEGRLRLQDAHAALLALSAQPLLAEADAALSNTTALRYNRRGESG